MVCVAESYVCIQTENHTQQEHHNPETGLTPQWWSQAHETYINQSLRPTLNTLIKSSRRNALVLLWIVNFLSRRHFYRISTSCFDVDPTCMQRTCARCEATFSYSSSEKLPYTSNVGNRLVSPAPFKTHIYVMQTSLHRQQFCLSVNLIAYHCHGSVKHVIQRSSGWDSRTYMCMCTLHQWWSGHVVSHRFHEMHTLISTCDDDWSVSTSTCNDFRRNSNRCRITAHSGTRSWSLPATARWRPLCLERSVDNKQFRSEWVSE